MQLFAVLGLVFLFMFGFLLSKATGEKHREAYFITPLFLWALKSFIKSLTKFLLFIAYCCCLADISSALFVIKLLQCANVNTLLNCPRWHPWCSHPILNHIILNDVSSVRVHLISQGLNLKIGNDILIPRVTHRGPRSHSWSPGKLCKYELMSSLIASRINSSDIILEFQIPAPSPVLPHWIDITRFRPDSHHYRTNMMSRKLRFHAEWWTTFTTIPWFKSWTKTPI